MQREASPSVEAFLRRLAQRTVELQLSVDPGGLPSSIAGEWSQVLASALIAQHLLGADCLWDVSVEPAVQEILRSLHRALSEGGLVRERVAELSTWIEHHLEQFDPSDDYRLLFDGFESFIAEQSPVERRRRGVYYTPPALVAFMVRAADEALKQNLGLSDGLQSSETCGEVLARLGRSDSSGEATDNRFVAVFDPAMGTGAFLAELASRNPELCRQLGGSELSLGPRILAEAQLQLITKRTVPGLNWGNTLLLRPEHIGRPSIIIGNPPYSGVSANRAYATIVSSYMHYRGEPIAERKTWLQDDYVKFFRWAEEQIEANGVGVLVLVTPHGFLGNPTFRGMRESLMRTFNAIDVLDLHGNANRRERTPEGKPDRNIFAIRQGVAVSVLSRWARADSCVVRHSDCWGATVDSKIAWLERTQWSEIPWTTVKPNELPFSRFFPGEPIDKGFQKALSVCEIFPVYSSGVVTSRDRLLVDPSRERLAARVRQLLDPQVPDQFFRDTYGVRDNYAWKLDEARELLRGLVGPDSVSTWCKRINYRPMQKLWVFFHPAFVWRPRDRVMHHLVAETNPALVTVRQLARHDFCWQHVAVTYGLVEACYLSNRTREINYVFPLFLDEGTVNISVTAMTAFSTYCDSSDVSERASTIFDYVYGLLSHPAYQRRYRSALAVDFPRVPLPSSRSEFMRLAERGRGLRQIVQQPLPEMGSIGEGGRPSEVALTALAQHVGVGQRCVDYELGAYRVVDQWVRRFGAEGLADIMRRIDATMAVQNESL